MLKNYWNKGDINSHSHNTTSDPYCGVVPMFSYIDSFIMAPHHRGSIVWFRVYVSLVSVVFLA